MQNYPNQPLGGTVAPLSSWLKTISLIRKKGKEMKTLFHLKESIV